MLDEITENARTYAAKQVASEEEALKKGMRKSNEFVEKGAGVYLKA